MREINVTSGRRNFQQSSTGRERLSKVTIRLFAEEVSPDNNDIIGKGVRT